MALSSVWIGYGCIVDPSQWSIAFDRWLSAYPCEIGRFEGDTNVLMIALATPNEGLVESMRLVELAAEMVFAPHGMEVCLSKERLEQSQQEWEQLRHDAQAVGYEVPAGQLLCVETNETRG